MKTIITTLFIVLLVGCAVNQQQQQHENYTFINISELVTAENVTQPVNETLPAAREIPSIKVTEGQLISFPNLKAVDPDGDTILYTFSAPLNTSGQWLTKEGDAGEYN